MKTRAKECWWLRVVVGESWVDGTRDTSSEDWRYFDDTVEVVSLRVWRDVPDGTREVSISPPNLGKDAVDSTRQSSPKESDIPEDRS